MKLKATVTFEFETNDPEDVYMDEFTAALFRIGDAYDWTIELLVIE